MSEIFKPPYLSDRKVFQPPDKRPEIPKRERLMDKVKGFVAQRMHPSFFSNALKTKILNELPQVRASLDIYSQETGVIIFFDKENGVGLYLDEDEGQIVFQDFLIRKTGVLTKEFSEKLTYYPDAVYDKLAKDPEGGADLLRLGLQDHNTEQIGEALESRIRFINNTGETFTLADFGAALDAKDPAAQEWVVTFVEEPPE